MSVIFILAGVALILAGSGYHINQRRLRKRKDISSAPPYGSFNPIITSAPPPVINSCQPSTVILELNEYQAANLRWLLHIAMSTSEDEYARQFPERNNVKASGLFTGDWTGEICWNLEQEMIDADFNPEANLPSPWPMTGWFNGRKSDRPKFTMRKK